MPASSDCRNELRIQFRVVYNFTRLRVFSHQHLQVFVLQQLTDVSMKLPFFPKFIVRDTTDNRTCEITQLDGELMVIKW